jgi:16S rRNA (adenine1518-N6/adenine1519-N6)-dimethyltransferase
VKLSQIQSTLAQLGFQPTRSLGQNFLHDQNLAAWIVAQLALQPRDGWVELGPGLGALTRFAIARSGHGLLIEKDERLVRFLEREYPQLDVVHGDAARFDLRELFARGPVKVFGNLPYYVSSQILFHFTSEPSPVAELIFTLQRELAERLAAAPHTSEYGALTVMIGRKWRAKYLRTLPPSVFVPAPKVESAVVHLVPREPDELPACDSSRFATLVRQGFSQRRKQLRKLVSGHALDWAEACRALGVSQTVRGEELSISPMGGVDESCGLVRHAVGNCARCARRVFRCGRP